MTLAEFINVVPAFSAVVQALALVAAAGTLTKSVVEWRRNNKFSSFEKFHEINKKLDAPNLLLIRQLLENDDKNLESVSYQDKHEFLAIYEEIGLAVNSKIINIYVAFYMFGYYVVLCKQSKYFWQGEEAPEKKSPYWSLFWDFASDMEKIDVTFKTRGIPPKALKF